MVRASLMICTLVVCPSIGIAQQSSPTHAGVSSKAKAAAVRKEEPTAQPGASKLPVRRVVVYKNGVGYFEHLGRVSGTQDVHIDFTSAQLNDVLMSLTVLDSPIR